MTGFPARKSDLTLDSSGPGLSCDEIVRELYSGLLGRPADAGGFQFYLAAMRDGVPLSDIIRQFVKSDEFQSHNSSSVFPVPVLPDLTELFSDKYIRKAPDSAIFVASSDDDIALMESLITKYRYYESFGVWTPRIDLDKQVTAAVIQGLGARNCLELGCFSGAVLSVLCEKGLDVCGLEVSHLAFLLAHPNIHEKIRFGNLLDLNFDTMYDSVLCMDVLEHVNPISLKNYIRRISRLLKQDGFAYVNSPMFGPDDIFGTVFEAYLPEWQEAGPDEFWRHMHCDAKGWPMHGHLVWASPLWWERAFLEHGLIRDRDIERVLHHLLHGFFEKFAPARRCFFVLRHPEFSPDLDAVTGSLASAVTPFLGDATA
ncbi:MAG: methyltransferase domain-containing protein [Alphaproteobacteria bacterium]